MSSRAILLKVVLDLLCIYVAFEPCSEHRSEPQLQLGIRSEYVSRLNSGSVTVLREQYDHT